MPNEEAGPLGEAEAYWLYGRALDAGRLIFEAVPHDARPGWAAGVLRLVLDGSGLGGKSSPGGRSWLDRLGNRSASGGDPFPLGPIERVLSVADDPSRWDLGHDVFDELRDVTLRFDASRRAGRLGRRGELHASVYLLAELVAKVAYNASDPVGPFDEDSGWWIAVNLRGFVENDFAGDAVFAKAAWDALRPPR